ncbi:Bud-site selection protein [Lactarius akahatsu]|uniref:Bud-site selection protein n=1 Tax=Lactarius akahatsu TaxID=416441 RepID=A0AAD4LQ43_9AGAM|nr:Bud-site selection protein [Lactarius akahatsu]
MQFPMHSSGIKRRHSSISSLFSQDNEATKIAGKLFHSMKEVKKAAKKAKAFETQKIVKRLKVSGVPSGKKNTEKLTLETELDALKVRPRYALNATDHNRIGVLALKSKLKKDKFLSNEPSVQTAISKLFPPDSDVTLTSEGMAIKLESRLLSSKTLSGAVNGVISSLCSALKPTDDHGNNVVDESGRPRKLQNVDLPVGTKSRARLEVSEGNPEDSTADRVSSPEADTDDDEPDNSAELEGDTSSDNSTTGGGPLSSRASLLPSRSDPPSDRASPIPHLGGVLKTPGANSVFLPTLSNGFVPGGLDSDWSDGETRVGGSIRKNRRGQRARRAIWEKKYGRKAKHLHKQEDSGATRGQRSSQRHVRGSQAVSHSRPTDSIRQYERANRGEEISNSHTPHEQKARRVGDLALHPSWEAKRRMKEKSSAAIIPSQGKRIKFDN